VSDLVVLPADASIQTAPIAELTGPEFAIVGQPARFDASSSADAQSRRLNYQWWLEARRATNPHGNARSTSPAFIALA